ncbi:MAG: hypothetical protein R3F41_15320 [Gammaproteobacteria bacterium]|nr:hypothetical protein [Pseudomonadales bacterium]MCP5346858.1 hypothetical protein [Pseudomonadales bacterium]
MSFKPVILIYDLNNALVDDIAASIGTTGLYTSINTYNEANAFDVVRQYNRGFGLLTNKLSCIIIGWNHHKKRRDQFLFKLRELERRYPFRKPTPVILITEDHLQELRQIALDPADGGASAYLHSDSFKGVIAEVLHKIVYEEKAVELGEEAFKALREED